MSSAHMLSDNEIGVLEELINISFGLSASLVEKMLDIPVRLHVPKISVMETKEINNILKETHMHDVDPLYVTKQLFKGDISGEIVFSISQKDASEFTKLLHKVTDNELDKNYIEGSLLELTNIMTSSCIGQLVEMLENTVNFVEPQILFLEKDNIITLEESNKYSQIIVMKTILDLEEESIMGDMFILTNPKSFVFLKSALSRMLG